MKARGFTLFTALIAFILIVLSLLLVQSMIASERSTLDIIADISEQEEMQAIADLSRADALQVFNFGIRYSIEDFSTRDDNPSPGGDGLPDDPYTMFPVGSQDWASLQDDFVKSRFGVGNNTRPFAARAARHLISLLQRTADSRGYFIDLERPDEAAMTTLLQNAFERQYSNSPEEFFEVVNCPQGEFEDCVGTFYVTLDLSPETVNDQEYEKFPLVRVENAQTGRILKEPILPRGKFRIYVPIRIFKALAGARKIAYAQGAGLLEEDVANQLRALSGDASINGNAVDIIQQRVDSIVGSGLIDDNFELVNDATDIVVNTPIVDNATELRKVSEFSVTLYFKENEEKYRVSSSTRRLAKDADYAVRITRNLN